VASSHKSRQNIQVPLPLLSRKPINKKIKVISSYNQQYNSGGIQESSSCSEYEQKDFADSDEGSEEVEVEIEFSWPKQILENVSRGHSRNVSTSGPQLITSNE